MELERNRQDRVAFLLCLNRVELDIVHPSVVKDWIGFLAVFEPLMG